MQYPVTVSKLLTLVAVVLFVLAFFAVTPGGHTLVPLGLAFGFAAFLVP